MVVKVDLYCMGLSMLVFFFFLLFLACFVFCVWIFWAYLGLSGLVLVSACNGLVGVWSCLVFSGIVWVCLVFSGLVWTCLGLSGHI